MGAEIIKKLQKTTPAGLWWKLSRKLYNCAVMSHRAQPDYYMHYRSYRYALKHSGEKPVQEAAQYMTARPNPGAGIGHQMANWIAGYWFAEQFGLEYAHIPFSGENAPFVPNSWDRFLGFGCNMPQTRELLRQGYKKVQLPSFDEHNLEEVQKIQKIIRAYAGQKVVFFLEQDQYYAEQYGVMEQLRARFYACPERANDRLRFDSTQFNIVIHIRRGDIALQPGQADPNWQERWLDNSYFINVLQETLSRIQTEKKIHIYIMSQGSEEDYPEFRAFENVTFCLDMGAQESFLHMVYADALITSKSSFSYKPALLNTNLKISPAQFWHGYPESSDWWLADNSGKLLG